jgi:hypothetical protein
MKSSMPTSVSRSDEERRAGTLLPKSNALESRAAESIR